MKNKGYSDYRLNPNAENPREVAFAEKWEFENVRSSRDHALINMLIPDAKERDYRVAATVIQWLGSNVGMGFVLDVIKESPDVKRYLKQGLL